MRSVSVDVLAAQVRRAIEFDDSYSRELQPSIAAAQAALDVLVGYAKRAEELEKQRPRHEWDDVRWLDDASEYEASCWCGWTETAWAHDAAEDALRDHLRANGAVVPE